MIGAGFWGIDHFTPPWDVFFLPLFNLLVLCYRFLFRGWCFLIILCSTTVICCGFAACQTCRVFAN